MDLDLPTESGQEKIFLAGLPKKLYKNNYFVHQKIHFRFFINSKAKFLRHQHFDQNFLLFKLLHKKIKSSCYEES